MNDNNLAAFDCLGKEYKPESVEYYRNMLSNSGIKADDEQIYKLIKSGFDPKQAITAFLNCRTTLISKQELIPLSSGKSPTQ